jgi:tRNA G18 (ribose-2'-O)-methylase SpoU
MFTAQKITSLDLPELEPYRTMRRQMDHREKGIFVAEGEKVVRRLIESKFQIISLLLPAKWLEQLASMIESRPEHITVYVAEKKLLESLTGFSMYQGLLAVGRIPAALSLENMIAQSSRPYLLLATDGLSSAENLGALVRNCAAFRVHAVIVGETCVSPYMRRAVRSSMGSIFRMPIHESSNLVNALKQLKQRNVRCIAAHPRAQGHTLPRADFRSDCCLVFGSEGYGISDAVLEECTESVAIPMPPDFDSLNVGSAAAAFLYEVNRQRGYY